MTKLSLFIPKLCVLLSTAGVVGAAWAPSAGAVPATGLITGAVSGVAGQPGADVCTYAIAVSGQPGSWAATGPRYEVTTASNGSYELAVPEGTYVLRFDPSCGSTVLSSYAAQYYLGQPDLESANAVSVSGTSPITGANAVLVAGFSVSGAVSAPGERAPSPMSVSAPTTVLGTQWPAPTLRLTAPSRSPTSPPATTGFILTRRAAAPGRARLPPSTTRAASFLPLAARCK